MPLYGNSFSIKAIKYTENFMYIPIMNKKNMLKNIFVYNVDMSSMNCL